MKKNIEKLHEWVKAHTEYATYVIIILSTGWAISGLSWFVLYVKQQ